MLDAHRIDQFKDTESQGGITDIKLWLTVNRIVELKAMVKDDPVPVELEGWVWQFRKQGKLAFVELFDGSTWKIVQVTLKKNKLPENKFDLIDEIYRGAALRIKGQLKADGRAPHGIEVLAEDMDVIHPSNEEFDQQVPQDAGVDVRLNKRHIVIRSPKTSAILKLRSHILKYTRDYFYSRGAEEVTPPTIVEAQAEGGAELFEIKYFDRKAYLTQSSQLYLEAAIFSLGNVFCILPSYRAEKSRTRRHLTEYTHIEGEYAFMDFEGLKEYLEDYIIYLMEQIKENDSDILELFGKTLEVPSKPFPRVSYKEAIEKLKELGHDIPYGTDISDAPERDLVNHYGVPIILEHFPTDMKPFYHKINEDDPSITNSADFIFPNLGEIIGCGERETDIDSMLDRMAKMDPPVNPEEYYWYMDLRRYGSIPHSGFGLGLERFLVWILDLDHIRDATLFPRLMNRVSP